MRDSAFPAFACATWVLAAAVAVTPLQARLTGGLNIKIVGNTDPLTKMIGSFKEAVGGLAFLKADSYYHGGARHLQCADEDHDHDHGDADDHGHDDADRHDPEEAVKVSAPTDWVSYVSALVSPTADRHAKGAGLAELTPLLAAATRLDPHHITAILTTAFWLSDNLNRSDEAIGVLEEGIRNNPQSWQLDSALGQILLKKRTDDPVLAAEYLSTAAQKQTITSDVEPFERRKVWMFLADAYERSGQVKKALQAYRQALKFFDPTDPAAARARTLSKISQLESLLAN